MGGSCSKLRTASRGPHSFTNNNAHKYVRLGCDEQVSMDTRSELMDVVYGKVIFLEVTANGVTIFRGND